MDNEWILIIAVIAGAILFFFFIRELICWYFKTTAVVEQLEHLNKTMTSIKTSLIPPAGRDKQP